MSEDVAIAEELAAANAAVAAALRELVAAVAQYRGRYEAAVKAGFSAELERDCFPPPPKLLTPVPPT
jgi:hypothetical protein